MNLGVSVQSYRRLENIVAVSAIEAGLSADSGLVFRAFFFRLCYRFTQICQSRISVAVVDVVVVVVAVDGDINNVVHEAVVQVGHRQIHRYLENVQNHFYLRVEVSVAGRNQNSPSADELQNFLNCLGLKVRADEIVGGGPGIGAVAAGAEHRAEKFRGTG